MGIATLNTVATVKIHCEKARKECIHILYYLQLTTQEIRDLKVVFDVFDVDNSNTIDLKELRRAMKILGFRVSNAEVKQMMADVDITRRG